MTTILNKIKETFSKSVFMSPVLKFPFAVLKVLHKLNVFLCHCFFNLNIIIKFSCLQNYDNKRAQSFLGLD